MRIELRPRSEMAEMPPVVAPDTDDAVSAPELAIELTVCSNCSTLVTPVFWMSSRVSTWTGRAVSASMRLIDDPVISTRSSCCCDHTAVGLRTNRPARAGTMSEAICLVFGFIITPE